MNPTYNPPVVLAAVAVFERCTMVGTRLPLAVRLTEEETGVGPCFPPEGEGRTPSPPPPKEGRRRAAEEQPDSELVSAQLTWI
jgi:hypothetical protein